MKSILKKVLFVVLILLIGIDLNLYTKEGWVLDCEPESLQEKYDVVLQWSHSLKERNIISISPEKFAKAAFKVMWCESNLNPKSKDKLGSQGINQLLPKTRELIGAPNDITDKGFREQLQYFEDYLVYTGKSNQIKCSLDLHALNFAPSRFNKTVLSEATPSLKGLDLNRDGVITREDFKLFQNKRTHKNEFINSL